MKRLPEDELTELFQYNRGAARLKYPSIGSLDSFPLYLACRKVHEFEKFIFALLVEYPEALLQNGWDKLTINPLHLACKHNRPDLVTLILKHNSSLLNLVTRFGETALQIACAKDFGHIVDILFKYPHLDVNKIINNLSGKTVLHDASFKMIPKLLNYNGINVDIKDNKNKTPFLCYLDKLNKVKPEETTKNEQIGIINMFVDKFPWVLHAACNIYSRQSVRHFADNQSEPQPNLFHYIAKLKNIEILKAVAPYIANNINDCDYNGVTPFHVVCGASSNNSVVNQEAVDVEFQDWFLNNESCDKNKVCNYGFTALHYACYHHDVQIVGKLIKLPNIILDIHDRYSETPLHQLFHQINISEIDSDDDNSDHEYNSDQDNTNDEYNKLQAVLEIITIMLDTGVQVNTKNRRGYSTLDKAIEVQDIMDNAIQRNRRRHQENMDLLNIIVNTLYLYEVKRRWKMFNFFYECYLEETKTIHLLSNK
jgi:ankyrin repeat protein